MTGEGARELPLGAANAIEIIEGGPDSRVILLCDHAGCRVPGEYADLGLHRDQLERHIGWDIGAADVTRALARSLGATAILDHVSRLVVDPNRRPFTPSSIPPVSDGCVVPGNENLDRAQALDRVRRWFLPYHRTVARVIARHRRRGAVPAIVAVHSFTPHMNRQDRPWQVGVLWRGDRRLSAPVLEALQRRDGLMVGDNQPYSGLREFGFTVTFHAQRARLPHIMFELRQNEVDSRAKAEKWAGILHEVLSGPLSDDTLYRTYEGDNHTPIGGLVSWRHASRASPLA